MTVEEVCDEIHEMREECESGCFGLFEEKLGWLEGSVMLKSCGLKEGDSVAWKSMMCSYRFEFRGRVFVSHKQQD